MLQSHTRQGSDHWCSWCDEMFHGRYIVIFIGTDGSGKSTLAHRTKAALPGARYVYFGMKDFRFSLARIVFEKNGDKGWLFRYVVLPIEYMIRNASLMGRRIHILDRVPGWAFAGNLRWLRFLYGSVLPTADTLVLCTGSAKAIVTRKPERTESECQADIEKWRVVQSRYPARHLVTIDTTDKTPDEAFCDLWEGLNKDKTFAGLVPESGDPC